MPVDDEEEPVFHPGVNFSDLNALRADLIKYISSSMEKELSTFKTTLRAETERHINQQVELVRVHHCHVHPCMIPYYYCGSTYPTTGHTRE